MAKAEKNKIPNSKVLIISIVILLLIAIISINFEEITGSVTKQPKFVSISSVDFSTPQENPLIYAYNKIYLTFYSDDLKQEFYIYDKEGSYVDRMTTTGNVLKDGVLRKESDGCIKSVKRPDFKYLCQISENLPYWEYREDGQYYLVPKVKGKLGTDKILFRYVK